MGSGARAVIAAIQMASQPGDISHNLAKAERMATQAARQGADLVCFPELFPTGYAEDLFAGLGQSTGAAVLERMQRVAAQLGTNLVVPYPEGTPSGLMFNAAAVITRAGRLASVFRKTYLWDWEKRVFARGEGYPLFDLGSFKFGILICYDAEFPEPARDMAVRGAHFLLVPSVWSMKAALRWQVQLPARALDNTVYVLGVNASGQGLCGSSMFVRPDGEIEKQLGPSEEGILLGRVDRQMLEECRREIPYLRDLIRKPAACERP